MDPETHRESGATRFSGDNDVARDGGYYGAAISVLLSENVSAYVRYEGSASALGYDNAVSGGVGVRF